MGHDHRGKYSTINSPCNNTRDCEQSQRGDKLSRNNAVFNPEFGVSADYDQRSINQKKNNRKTIENRKRLQSAHSISTPACRARMLDVAPRLASAPETYPPPGFHSAKLLPGLLTIAGLRLEPWPRRPAAPTSSRQSARARRTPRRTPPTTPQSSRPAAAPGARPCAGAAAA